MFLRATAFCIICAILKKRLFKFWILRVVHKFKLSTIQHIHEDMFIQKFVKSKYVFNQTQEIWYLFSLFHKSRWFFRKLYKIWRLKGIFKSRQHLKAREREPMHNNLSLFFEKERNLFECKKKLKKYIRMT